MSQASTQARTKMHHSETESVYVAPNTAGSVVVTAIGRSQTAAISPTAPLPTMTQAQENPPPTPPPAA